MLKIPHTHQSDAVSCVAANYIGKHTAEYNLADSKPEGIGGLFHNFINQSSGRKGWPYIDVDTPTPLAPHSSANVRSNVPFW